MTLTVSFGIPVRKKFTIIRRKQMTVRNKVPLMLLILAFTVVAVRLFVLCIMQHDKYQQMADDNVLSETALKAERGMIYDSNGNILAWQTS